MIFRDFYEFITKTIEYLKHNEDYILYIKPHPNGLPGNSYFFDEIKRIHIKIIIKLFLSIQTQVI